MRLQYNNGSFIGLVHVFDAIKDIPRKHTKHTEQKMRRNGEPVRNEYLDTLSFADDQLVIEKDLKVSVTC